MQITIANVSLLFDSQFCSTLSNELLNKLEPFSNHNSCYKPNFTLCVVRNSPIVPKIACNNEEKILTYDGDNDQFSIFKSNKFSLHIDWKTKTSLLNLHLDEATESSKERIVFWSLKIIITLLSIENGGIPLHSSGAYKQKGLGILFCGPSQVGKSSILQILKNNGWNALSDEVNIAMPNNNTWRIYPTPFSSTLNLIPPSNESVHLQKIFILNQSKQNYCIPMSKAKKFDWLVKTSYTYPTSYMSISKLLTNIEKIIGQIPIEMLFFLNDPSIAQFLEETK